MRMRGIGWGLAVLALAAAGSLSMARAQAAGAGMPEGLPLPPAVEKELAAKAIDVTEVTLGKNMLDFAAKFMKDKDEDEAKARKLIQGLKGIYVRDYTFEKEGDYSMDQLKQLRAYFETSEWSPIVHSVERRKGETTETTDVLVKTVNGETQGMFILSAEPKELSIVLILGPIKMEDLGELHNIGGLHVLQGCGKEHEEGDQREGQGWRRAMRRFLFVFACFFALLVPVAVLASGGEGGFDGVVRAIEMKYHAHATRIPFLGLISFVARKATQGGVSNLHVAEFEHFDAAMDGEELNRMVEQKLGAGWERMIRETKRNGSEQTLIFVHPEGNRMGMFIARCRRSRLERGADLGRSGSPERKRRQV